MLLSLLESRSGSKSQHTVKESSSEGVSDISAEIVKTRSSSIDSWSPISTIVGATFKIFTIPNLTSDCELSSSLATTEMLCMPDVDHETAAVEEGPKVAIEEP